LAEGNLRWARWFTCRDGEEKWIVARRDAADELRMLGWKPHPDLTVDSDRDGALTIFRRATVPGEPAD
jgi:hypothetical protein